MVTPALLASTVAIGRFVAAATPAAFKVIDKTCSLLEANLSVSTGVAAGVELEERFNNAIAAQGIIALKAACEVRKGLRRRK